ncbi:MAG: RNA methyltransferase [Methyloligellaceae bacterium]
MTKTTKDAGTREPESAAAAGTPQARPARIAPPPAVILIEPQLGENIGTAARAMANFGLTDLRLVAPRDDWPNEKARAAASGADAVIDGVRVFESVEAAVGELHFLCATTARRRDMVKPVLTPETAVREMQARGRAGQACGILFGRERAGLDNDQVALADAIVTAPVNPGFASLNLAQSVLLLGYEWLKQSGPDGLGRRTPFDGPAYEGLQMRSSRPATRAEIIGFLEHLEHELDASGFLRPPQKRPIMVRSIRNMFLRLGATEQEVRTLRGIVASLVRAHRRRKKVS